MADFHIAMFPWLAIGHMTPYIQLANELASRGGHKISILVPNKTLLKFRHLILHPNLIVFHPVTFPNVDGLPHGIETASDIPLQSNHLLASAMDLTQDLVETILSSAKPDLVFYDFAHWIPDIAKRFGIKSVCYHVVSATALVYTLVPARNVPKDRPLTEEEVRTAPASFPSSSIVLRGDEVKKSILLVSSPPPSEWRMISFFERVTTSMKNCDALSIRTCRELEGKFCDYIGKQYRKSVLLTGCVLLDQPGAKILLEERWDMWLSPFERDAVVFCAFGSQYILEKDQFQELVLGFELTGLPFFIALKPPVGCTTMEEPLPEGFEDRVRGRGVVYGGRVQQPLILSHCSIGCFVSHCGFGSMWEGLMSDNQIVLVPQLGDQTLNTRLLVEELKVAVEVEKEENGWFSKESLSRAVKSVMDKDSEVGIMVKKNLGKLKNDLVKPGLMHGYFDKFVEDLHELVNQ